MDIHAEADTLARVREAVVVLEWDHTMVAAKVRRAVSGALKFEPEDLDDPELATHDARGSASVALRCLDRDKLALTQIYDWDEQFQDTAIDLLACRANLARDSRRSSPAATSSSGRRQRKRRNERQKPDMSLQLIHRHNRNLTDCRLSIAD